MEWNINHWYEWVLLFASYGCVALLVLFVFSALAAGKFADNQVREIVKQDSETIPADPVDMVARGLGISQSELKNDFEAVDYTLDSNDPNFVKDMVKLINDHLKEEDKRFGWLPADPFSKSSPTGIENVTSLREAHEKLLPNTVKFPQQIDDNAWCGNKDYPEKI